MSGAYDSLFISNASFGKGKASIGLGGVFNEIAAWPPQPRDTGILYCFNQVIVVLIIYRFGNKIYFRNLLSQFGLQWRVQNNGVR